VLRNLVLVALAAFTLPACATITTGTSQPVTVMSEPAGATCELQREGATVGVVNPTPGTVQISKSSRDMTIRCTRPGYSPGLASVASQMQGMTAGNILIGGFIGLGIDAASGALSQYPTNVTVILPPEDFATQVERDAFFATRIAETHRLFGERSAAARGSCPPGSAPNCDAALASLAAERDTEVARLEALRNAATYTRT
jgi:hypothetical protein